MARFRTTLKPSAERRHSQALPRRSPGTTDMKRMQKRGQDPFSRKGVGLRTVSGTIYRKRVLTPFLMVVALLAGCATSLPKIEAEKLPPTPVEFKENWTIASPAVAQERGEWWKVFNDPLLDELVTRAERANTSIQVAAARLTQARAVARITDADRALQVGAGASARRAQGLIGGNPPGPPNNLFAAGVDLSYEIDLFGKLSHASQAAVLDAQSREGLLQSTRLLVQAQVAQVYLALRALDTERGIVRDTLAAYRETLSLTERRWRAGDGAERVLAARERVEHRTAGDSGRRAEHGAHAPARRLRRAVRHARGADSSRCGEGGLVPQHFAHCERWVCVVRNFGPPSVVLARLADRCSRLASHPRWRSAQGRGAGGRCGAR